MSSPYPSSSASRQLGAIIAGRIRFHGGRGRMLVLLALAVSILAGGVKRLHADSPSIFVLANQAAVDSQGIFLEHLTVGDTNNPLPHILLADAPAIGRSLVLTRQQVQAILRQKAPDYADGKWDGADRIKITRKMRVVRDTELLPMLCSVLQKDNVKERGELEIRFTRPWMPASIPDEPIDIKIVELPSSGVSQSFIIRFEIKTGKDLAGSWQAVLAAKIWRDVWVAAGVLKRGQLLNPSDLVKERRDTLIPRDYLALAPEDDSPMEVTETIMPGTPIMSRSVRPRPLVHRGDMVNAVVQDGPLTISLRVEVLEEGATGQAIRVRNPATKKELRGKVQNEQSILISI
jgi:flagella basal body P-ring formation protein FlgA